MHCLISTPTLMLTFFSRTLVCGFGFLRVRCCRIKNVMQKRKGKLNRCYQERLLEVSHGQVLRRAVFFAGRTL